MTLRSGTGQACESCKFQRRRCTPQCLLAPFFPADQPHVFQSVHHLFGVKHIQKLLKEMHPDQRAEAMDSVKYMRPCARNTRSSGVWAKHTVYTTRYREPMQMTNTPTSALKKCTMSKVWNRLETRDSRSKWRRTSSRMLQHASASQASTK